jgi:hypothetical protein
LFPRFSVISPVRIENIFYLFAQRWVFHWASNLDTPEEIPRCPVCARQIDFWVTRIFESVNPAVLQEPANDTADADILADSWYTGAQTTDSSYQKSNLHSRLRSRVERLDHVFVD